MASSYGASSGRLVQEQVGSAASMMGVNSNGNDVNGLMNPVNNQTKREGEEQQQKQWLMEASRRIQEQVYYMRRAMDEDDLAVTMERASFLLSELGDPSSHPQNMMMHHHTTGGTFVLSPKSYYELHMRTLEEMPTLQDFFHSITEDDPASMLELYQSTQYCPKLVPRLYLQICAGSVLLQDIATNKSNHGYFTTRRILNDLADCVKCVQCPVRGLFLRHYLLQAIRDKLPDSPVAVVAEMNDDNASLESGKEGEDIAGTVQDSYQFVLNNFIEMNKLWVRIQHMPVNNSNNLGNRQASFNTINTYGNPSLNYSSKSVSSRPSKEARKKREKERNELRILVGTNLERLSKLDGVTVQIYEQCILPTILNQISVCRDALAQAYLMDCIIQVFPDDFHIPTLSLFLSVCPKLKEKVNVRTILNAIMDRLANYYADEILLNNDDEDTQSSMLQDAFGIFHNCIQSVFQARGPNMPAKEIIRLQTALLNFSLRCFPNRMDHLSLCLQSTVQALTSNDDNPKTIDENGSDNIPNLKVLPSKPLDKVAEAELEKLLSIPLDTLALKVLDLDHYSDLLTFLPWDNRKQVAVVMIKAVEASNIILTELHPITQLFQIILPLVQTEEAALLQQRQDSLTSKNQEEDGTNRSELLGSLVGGAAGNSARHSSITSEHCVELTAMLREEQILLAKLVHLLHNDDTDIHFEMLTICRNVFSKADADRRSLILSPLVFRALHLVQRIIDLEFPPIKKKKTETKTNISNTSSLDPIVENNSEKTEDKVESDDKEMEEDEEETTEEETTVFNKKITCRKIFVFLQNTISMMLGKNSETTFKLYLQVAIAANQCAKAIREIQSEDKSSGDSSSGSNQFSTMAYELIAQAFTVYEDEITDSKTQQNAIVAMIGTLLACRYLDKDDYEALITKTTQYAAKQLKKTDQCKMVILCSHLFYTGNEDDPTAYRNPQRVLECLQRSLKIADACTMSSPANVQLFVDILDRYVFHYEMKNPVISSNFVSGLIALISENMESIDDEIPAVSQANHQFQQIVNYITDKKNNPSTADRFAAIEC